MREEIGERHPSMREENGEKCPSLRDFLWIWEKMRGDGKLGLF